LQTLIFMAVAMLPDIPNGSLLFVENGYNVVERFTDSSYSHVAIVIDGVVYEANPPNVRTFPVSEWFTNIGKANEGVGSPAIVEIVSPNRPYTQDELTAMKTYLDEQVGRRYSVRGYLRKTPGDGIHCAEMCATALEKAGVVDFSTTNCTLSPGTLREAVTAIHHRDGQKLYVTIRKEFRRSTGQRLKDYWSAQKTMCGWSWKESLKFYSKPGAMAEVK
jgi:hypothetical protein